MGVRLIAYYEYAKEKGGMLAQYKLAKETLLPKSEAKNMEDSPENIVKFKHALKKVVGEEPQF